MSELHLSEDGEYEFNVDGDFKLVKKDGHITITYDDGTCFDIKKLDDKFFIRVEKELLDCLMSVICSLNKYIGRCLDQELEYLINEYLVTIFKTTSKHLHIEELANIVPILTEKDGVVSIKLLINNREVVFMAEESKESKEFESYCKCQIPSPSAHHNNCINDYCGLPIKTIYYQYNELEAENKKLKRIIEVYKTYANRDIQQQVDEAIKDEEGNEETRLY